MGTWLEKASRTADRRCAMAAVGGYVAKISVALLYCKRKEVTQWRGRAFFGFDLHSCAVALPTCRTGLVNL